MSETLVAPLTAEDVKRREKLMGLTDAVISLAHAPLMDPWSSDHRQLPVPLESHSSTMEDITKDPVLSYVFTMPGGKLAEPFPEAPGKGRLVNAVREAAWRTMTQKNPSAIGLTGRHSEGSYWLEPEEVSVEDRFSSIGWVLTYPMVDLTEVRKKIGSDWDGFYSPSREVYVAQHTSVTLPHGNAKAQVGRGVVIYQPFGGTPSPIDIISHENVYRGFIPEVEPIKVIIDLFRKHVGWASPSFRSMQR